MRRAAVLLLSCAGLLIVAATALWRARTPKPDPSLARLGAWKPGMSLRRTFESLPPGGGERTRLRMLTGNTESWVARWHLVAGARTSIDASSFIVRDDLFGAAFLGHLLAKADEGVRVRLLIDALGGEIEGGYRGNDLLDELANHPKVAIKLYRPVSHRWLQALVHLNPAAAIASEHDKILVADDEHAIVGGRNVGVEYFAEPAGRAEAMEDADLEIEDGALARALVRAFETEYLSDRGVEKPGERMNVVPRRAEMLEAKRQMDRWVRTGRAPVPAATEDAEAWAGLVSNPLAREAPGGGDSGWTEAETRLVDSVARFGDTGDAITESIRRLVAASRRRILVESPYLVLSEPAIELLAEASARGVEVLLLTNSPATSDNALSQAFFLEQWPEILARVPRMRLYVRGEERHTLHSKVGVFDDALTFVGTYNLDPTSMATNGEVMVAAWSEAFAERASEAPLRRIAAGPPQTYEYRIRRDAEGRAVRGEDGRPIVEFGPRDHYPPERWTALNAYWTALRAASWLPGVSPIL